MTSLKERIALVERPRNWLNAAAAEHHYMHRAVHPRASPFGWGITFDGKSQIGNAPAGFIIFASIHYTKLRGEFGYPDLPTKWQVLSLARLWLHDDLPHNSETVVIAKALKLVQRRWLEVHPPRFMNEPYHVRKVISYADNTYGHEGTIYKAANFRRIGTVESKTRHKNTRGSGMGGNTLTCYIYDLKEPRWSFDPTMGLPLWAAA